MSRIDQMQRLFDLREVKVDGLKLDITTARTALSRMEERLAVTERALVQASEHNQLDFDELFDATIDVEDPHSRLTSVTRTILQNRRTLEMARRDHRDAYDDAEEARLHLSRRTQAFMEAQAQLDGIESLLDRERQQQQAIDDDKADDDALDQFAAHDKGRTEWAL